MSAESKPTIGFIADGYTERSYIRETTRLHPAMRFEHRPTLLSELVAYRREVESMPEPMDTYRFAAKYIAGKLVSWDAKDGNGRPIPITGDNLLKMKHPLFMRLLSIILGAEACDLDPGWTLPEKDEHRKDLAIAKAECKTYGHVREERDEKNSSGD